MIDKDMLKKALEKAQASGFVWSEAFNVDDVANNATFLRGLLLRLDFAQAFATYIVDSHQYNKLGTDPSLDKESLVSRVKRQILEKMVLKDEPLQVLGRFL